MKTKICTKCNKEKELSEFHKQKLGKFGICSVCKECKKIKAKAYYDINKEKIKKYSKKYRDMNKEEILKYSKEYKDKNKEKIAKRNKEYRDKNKEKIKNYVKNRRQSDLIFKLTGNLRHRLYSSLNGKTKSLPTMFLIGCEIDYLMYHIQCQFKKGMNWDNYGEWHVDHKRPCASFDLSDPEEQKECFNYTNLQPLWDEENWKKGKQQCQEQKPL